MSKHVNITSLDPLSQYMLEWQKEMSQDLRQYGRMSRLRLKPAPSSLTTQNYVGHIAWM